MAGAAGGTVQSGYERHSLIGFVCEASWQQQASRRDFAQCSPCLFGSRALIPEVPNLAVRVTSTAGVFAADLYRIAKSIGIPAGASNVGCESLVRRG